MGLFDGKTKNEKKDLKDSLFEPTEKEKVFEIKHAKAIIRIDDNFVRIARKSTFTNVLLQGLDGEKKYCAWSSYGISTKSAGKNHWLLTNNIPRFSRHKRRCI